MQSHHLIYQSQWMVPMDAAALDTLLHQCRAYNQQHDITGILLYSKKGVVRRQHFRNFRVEQRRCGDWALLKGKRQVVKMMNAL